MRRIHNLIHDVRCRYLIRRHTGLSRKQLIRLYVNLVQRDDNDWTQYAGGMIKNIAFTLGDVTLSVSPDSYFDTKNVVIYVQVSATEWQVVFNTLFPHTLVKGDWQVVLKHLYKAVRPK
jgi:hypothetical protein